jgi:hypothetical protein
VNLLFDRILSVEGTNANPEDGRSTLASSRCNRETGAYIALYELAGRVYTAKSLMGGERCSRRNVRFFPLRWYAQHWCASVVAAAQKGDASLPAPPKATLHVRALVFHYLGTFKRVSPDDIGVRLTQKGLLPVVERPYDQAKVDLIKAEVIEIYREHGIAVGAYSALEPAGGGPRAVRVILEVYKL